MQEEAMFRTEISPWKFKYSHERNIVEVAVRIGINVIIWFKIGPVVIFCKSSNNVFGTIKGGKILDQLSDY
jgi:hypothetical protein